MSFLLLDLQTEGLRNMLEIYRASAKMYRHLYHELFHKCESNVHKNKRVLMKLIYKRKADDACQKMLTNEANAKVCGQEGSQRESSREDGCGF